MVIQSTTISMSSAVSSSPSWPTRRTGAQGSCSTLQGLQKAGSNFLDLGTPLPAGLPEDLRSIMNLWPQ